MVHAYVLAETRPGAVVKVSELVAEIPGVRFTKIITGPYEVIAAVEAESIEDLGKVVLHGIRAVEGVTRTLTCRSAPARVASGPASRVVRLRKGETADCGLLLNAAAPA